MAEAKPLAIEDMDGIPEAILSLVSKWEELPFKATQNTVCWNNHTFEQGIGFFPAPGAVYLKQYVSGSFEGQIPVNVQYRTVPTTNKARINSQKVLEELGKWLETCSISLKDERTKVDKIRRTSGVIKAGAYQDGSEVYQCTMNIIYTSKK